MVWPSVSETNWIQCLRGEAIRACLDAVIPKQIDTEREGASNDLREFLVYGLTRDKAPGKASRGKGFCRER